MTDAISQGPVPRTAPRPAAPGGHIHSAALDFLLLGGGSIPVLAAVVMLADAESRPAILVTVLVLSQFLNNPHFMHSYQIFYDAFGRKLRTGPQGLRVRYAVAGILVPALLVGWFALSAILADPALMGRAVNVMLFLVGWHYVKQGYGIFVVESVFQRRFLSETEKTVLRWNGYLAWLFSWVVGNLVVQRLTMQEVQYVTLGLPEWLAWVTGGLALVAGAATAVLLVRRALAGRMAWAGMFGYLSAVYVWLVLAMFEPMLVLLGPAFHSLQYLAVVYRYELNRTAKTEGEPVALFSGLLRLSAARAQFWKFVVLGVLAGTLAFHIVPEMLDAAIAYREDLFGPSMFVFMFFTFINVHHYFMDNVMWRKENPDVKEHLFS